MVRSFTIKPSGTALTALAWSPAGDELAVAGRDGLVELWSTSGEPRLVRRLIGLHSMFGQPEAIQSVAFSPSGRLVAASDDDKTGTAIGQATDEDFAGVAVWQAATGRLIATPTDLNGALGNGVKPVGDDLLAFSPNGRLLALSLFDRSVLILDPTTGQVRQVLISATGTTSLAFAPDGTLANGTAAGTVELWNPITGREIDPPLLVGAAPVASIAFDRSGQWFATAAQGERSVKLWLASGLGQLGPGFTTERGATTAVAFGAGGRLLAIGDDGRGFEWPISPLDWEREACTVAGRGMTRPEWTQLGIDARYTTVCP
jgi:WD40 repeat protein